MRLCNQYVPDVQRVSACMSHYRRYLSPACRAVVRGGARKGKALIERRAIAPLIFETTKAIARPQRQ
jgi:hypothetical protein